MFNHLISICLISGFFLSTSLTAQTFQSENRQTQLLELYSSQGCSSCPPAERWISKQLAHPELWKQFIPIVFHVDYWDYLGWKDPFSSSKHSQRQRAYKHEGGISSVYTPGMVLNGQEWRGWYRGHAIPESKLKPGILSAELLGHNLTVNFQQKTSLILNVSLLGFGLSTDVTAGENRGRDFTENFVVLYNQSTHSRDGSWKLDLPDLSNFSAERYALVIWVSKTDSLQPLQTTGGWIINN